MEKIRVYLARKRWVPIAIATLILSVLLTIASPAFLTLANLQGVLVQASVTGIVAVGMTLIILSGGIDISLGAILFFTSTIFATIMHSTGSYALAFSAAIFSACALGGLNGILVVKFRINPLITTLATYTMYRGLAIHLSGAENIPVPREMGVLGNGKIYGLPVPIILLVVTLATGVYLLTKTRFGIYLKAIGNSAQSARESSLPVSLVTVAAYLIGGLTTGIAGLVLLARVGGLQSGIGIGIEFTVIAAVVLGGTKLSGGTGTVFGSIIGAIFLVLIDNGLNLMSVTPYIYDAVKGFVLLVAVVTDRVSLARQANRLLEHKAARIRSTARLGLK